MRKGAALFGIVIAFFLLAACGAKADIENFKNAQEEDAAQTERGSAKEFSAGIGKAAPFSYTYLDVYKRQDLRLTWYSNIDPDKTVEIVNYMKDHAAAGDTIFFDIYTDEEKAALKLSLIHI